MGAFTFRLDAIYGMCTFANLKALPSSCRAQLLRCHCDEWNAGLDDENLRSHETLYTQGRVQVIDKCIIRNANMSNESAIVVSSGVLSIIYRCFLDDER